jgi:hypothetical protein
MNWALPVFSLMQSSFRCMLSCFLMNFMNFNSKISLWFFVRTCSDPPNIKHTLNGPLYQKKTNKPWMVSPGWGLVGRGVNIGGKGSQLSPDYECFILHNIRGQSSFSLSFDGHLGLSHWDGRVPRTQLDKFSLKPNGSTWQTGDTVTRDGDVFVIQKGAWRKHMLRIIPIRIFRSGRTSRIPSVSRGEKWGQTANTKLSVSFPSFLTYPHQTSNPETSKHEVVGWYWNTVLFETLSFIWLYGYDQKTTHQSCNL